MKFYFVSGDDHPARQFSPSKSILHVPAHIHNPAHKVGITLIWAICFLAAFEIALQVRSQLRYGQSVFNAVSGEARYVTDEPTQLKVFRQNHVFHGDAIEIRTNEHGLRSPPVSALKPDGSIRIAVIGASTVMGAYAPRNEDTFSYRLGRLLELSHPTTHIEVINAGVPGYGLSDETQMLEKMILPLHPDIVIVYSGFNDFAEYCRKQPVTQSRRVRGERVGLPLVKLPAWLMSVEMIHKNTVGLRPPLASKSYLAAEAVDLTPYKQKLEELIHVAQQANVKLVFSTNARAFRRDQPLPVQEALSETARYYYPCFDTAGLNTLHERHNRAILEVTKSHDIPSVRLDDLIPGGRRYFVDSNHFSNEGERKAAEILQYFLDQSELFADS